MPTLNFENATLATNVDLEDINVQGFRELKNLRQRNGRLLKTFGFGTFINAADKTKLTGFNQDNLFTFIETNLTGDKLYTFVDITGLNAVKLVSYDSALDAWTLINNSLGTAVTFNSMTFLLPKIEDFFHDVDRNPMFQLANVLRVYPGRAIGTNAPSLTDAQGVWMAFINRDYYDELFTPTAQFYGYPMNIAAPALTLTITQLQGGSFSPATDDIDTRFYKFSNIYDGVQESLLSDQTGLTYDDGINMFGRFSFNFTVNSTTTFDLTKQSNRITATNVYRALDADADYELVQTIDYLRPTGKVITGTSALTGQTRVYIPEATTIDFDLFTGNFTLELAGGGGFLLSTITPPTGTGNTIFQLFTGNILIDLWNVSWRLVDSLGAEMGKNTLGGSYSGMNTMILNDVSPDLGEGNFAGGIIEITSTGFIVDNISSVATNGSGGLTLTTSRVHFLEVDDIVTLESFATSGNELYNGTFTVLAVPSTTTFDIDNVAFNADEAGTFIKQSDTRILDQNKGKAVHSVEEWTIERTTGLLDAGSWTLLSPVDGLFFPTKSGDVVTYTFFDPNITAGIVHPLQDEKTIDVNARFVVEEDSRTFHFNAIVNPTSSSPETFNDSLFFSEVDQPDVVPASNEFSILDREGGEGTGLAVLFGNIVCMKKQAIITLYRNNSNNTAQWFLRESAFNIGNIAPQGFIAINDATLYLTSVDGIYRFTLNDLAEANQSSVKHLRISELINDTFLALTLTQKEAVEVIFEPIEQEVYFKLNTRIFAWSIEFETWREVDSTNVPDSPSDVIFALDENANPMAFNNVDKIIYNTSVSESTDIAVTSKTFVTNDIRPEVVRFLNMTYKSSQILTAEIRTEKDGLLVTDTANKSITIPSSSGSIISDRFRISTRAEKYNARVISTVTDTTDIEIHKLFIGNEAK